jgi:hypothetical protein
MSWSEGFPKGRILGQHVGEDLGGLFCETGVGGEDSQGRAEFDGLSKGHALKDAFFTGLG